MIFILFILAFFLLVLGLYNFKTYINPVSIYLIGYVLALFFCLVYYKEWDMNHFHSNTFALLGFSFVTYFCVCFIMNKIMRKNIRKKNVREVLISKQKLQFSFILLFLIFLLLYKYKMNITGASNISQAVYILDQMKIENTSYQLPFVLRQLEFLTYAISFYFSFIYVHLFVFDGNRSTKNWVSLIVVLGFIGTLLSGSRGSSFSYLFFMVIIYGILKYKKEKNKISLNFKRLILSFLGLFVILFAFIHIASLLGRDYSGFDSSTYILGVYCGAEIKNLDDFLNILKTDGTLGWGKYTFPQFFPNESKWNLLSFNYCGDFFLGNVYTQFQSYIQDFGFEGAIVLIIIMAMIFYYFYEKSLYSSCLENHYFDMNIFIYGYLGQGALLCFFSDRFYSIFNTGPLKLLFFLWIISRYFERNSPKSLIKIK